MDMSNYERMIQLVTEVFDVKNDPDQLDVDQQVIERLHTIHPATLSEKDYGEGPVAWILVIPTTTRIMEQFVAREITEQELYNLTQPGEKFEAVYLCSATVLPEYRNKGLALQMTLEAIKAIQEQHGIKALFVWPFSKEGDSLAEKAATLTGLTLLKRP
ncbi:MAG: GCN5-related N-acetyltransferase (GNAT)-like protein [Flavipsychrobacter sp.]|nr:GCN5-related N-acetyltransferase (GNAT)-like protein [Flavipsychrobacter sp.]